MLRKFIFSRLQTMGERGHERKVVKIIHVWSGHLVSRKGEREGNSEGLQNRLPPRLFARRFVLEEEKKRAGNLFSAV